jgi:hypothetical protein
MKHCHCVDLQADVVGLVCFFKLKRQTSPTSRQMYVEKCIVVARLLWPRTCETKGRRGCKEGISL